MEHLTDIYKVEPGMIIAEDIFTNGSLLAKKGMRLTTAIISKLSNFKVQSVKVISPNSSKVVIKKTQQPETIVKLETMKKIKTYIDKFLSNYKHSYLVKEIVLSIMQKHCLEDEQLLKALMVLRSNNHFDHSLKVAILSLATGILLNLEKKELINLAKAGLLYDIGKCFIDNKIFLKKHPDLTIQERELLKEHVHYGYVYLHDKFSEDIALAALQHHERFDGSGYPNSLKNKDMTLFSKIIAVVDVFVALRSERSHREAFHPNEAIEYILGAGNILFDYEIVCAFIKIVSVYSIGSIVLLSNGIYGMIIDNEKNSIGRPVIQTLYDHNFNDVFTEIIDLSLNSKLFIKKVIECT